MDRCRDIYNLLLRGYIEFLGNLVLDFLSCVCIFISLMYILSLFCFNIYDMRLLIDTNKVLTHVSRALEQRQTSESEVNIEDL